MNRGKVGRPYMYPNSVMASIAMVKIMWGDSYRRCKGKLKRCWPGKEIPDFSTIWKRIVASMPAFERDPAFRSEPGSTVRLGVDSTGTKNGNRGEWIRMKRNVKRGFFKMLILVDLDTLRMRELCPTDMDGGDAAQLPGMMRGC